MLRNARFFNHTVNCYLKNYVSCPITTTSTTRVKMTNQSTGYHRANENYNKYSKSYQNLSPYLSKDEMAKAFIWELTEDERHQLFHHLHQFGDSNKTKTTAPPAPLSQSVLKSVFLVKCFPFIGFGFLDNFIMIIAGEYIDVMFGSALGISTMAAAGLGNCISDVAGLGSASYIEKICSKFGVKLPPLTAQQISSKQFRWTAVSGRVFGVTLGCLIGMFPLLLFKDKSDRTSEDQSKHDDDKSTHTPMSGAS